MLNILVVDDEKEIGELIDFYLQNDGFNTIKIHDGDSAIDYINNNGEDIDLAILDIMMPGKSGFEVLAEIRKKFYFPVIMLTAKIADLDKINGLSLGADDYVTKPFNPLELTARVKAQLRRVNKYSSEGNKNKNFIDAGALHINTDSRRVFVNDREIVLTKYEYDILLCLAKNKGRVISAEQLFESVWGEKFLDNNNTVMTHIARIREKMKEDGRKSKVIKTVWGVGYTIED